jgi:hypothetical protein
MKSHRPTAAVVLAASALALGACGDDGDKGSSEIASNAVAVVAGTPVLRSEFDALWNSTVKAYPALGRSVPKPGTPEYRILRNQLLEGLVQRIVTEKKAQEDLRITVTGAELDRQLRDLKERVYGGSEQRYRQYLAAHGQTDEEVRASIKSQILSGRIAEALARNVRVSGGEVQAFYRTHRSQYGAKPLAEVKSAIRQELVQAKRSRAFARWTHDARREFRSKIRYADGFSAPPSANAG